jgi:hypothetical protein
MSHGCQSTIWLAEAHVAAKDDPVDHGVDKGVFRGVFVEPGYVVKQANGCHFFPFWYCFILFDGIGHYFNIINVC